VKKKIIIGIVIILSAFAIKGMLKKTKKWDTDKFKRMREIIKLKEFAEYLNKIQKDKAKGQNSGSIKK